MNVIFYLVVTGCQWRNLPQDYPYPNSVYEGVKVLLTKVERRIALRLLKIWADQGYTGDLDTWLHEQWGITLEIVLADPSQIGFAVQPRRWERTFAWLGKYRRLSRDHEHTTTSSKGFIYLASIRTLLKRLDR